MSLAFAGRLLEIVGLNLILAGDNAVVIALAAAALPQRLRRRAIWIGSLLAAVVRILATVLLVALFRYAAVKIVGGVVLIGIAVQMVRTRGHGDDAEHASTRSGLTSAIATIVIADLVMSLDNALATAAAANGSVVLVVLGLLIGIPVVSLGASLIVRLLNRWPWLTWVGATLVAAAGAQIALTAR